MPRLNQGRKRDLHPEFFSDERVLQVSCCARLLFLGLATVADREGRLEEPHPVTLKARFLPVDQVDCGDLLDQLVNVGLVKRYEVDGQKLLWLPGFKRRNHPHPREVKSALAPHPDEHRPRNRAQPAMHDPQGQTLMGMEGGVAGRDLRDLRDPSGPSGSAGPSGSSEIETSTSSLAGSDEGMSQEPPAEAAKARKQRAPSWQERVFEELQLSRQDRLERLQVDSETEHLPIAFVNSTLAKIAEAAGGGTDGQDAVLLTYDAYLQADWPAAYEPPYNFRGFASPKVWPKLLAALEPVEAA